MNRPAIEAEGLTKRFGDVQALDGIDLEVAEGTVLGILGPNGAGKTTTVRILSTLLKPDAGRATVGGFDVVRQAAEVRSLIGLTGQYAAVDELLSGRENLMMIGRLLGMTKPDARRRADELLSEFGLAEAAAKIVKTYSGGMRRRLDLAASLVGRPRFLYLDEPTTGLDPRGRRHVWDLIGGLVREGATVLLTTQYLDEADQLADRVAVVDHGRVVAAGTPDELKEKVGGRVVEIRPADASDLDAVAEIAQKLARTNPSIDRVAQLVTVPVGDTAFLATIARRLEKNGIQVTDLAFRRPTLDEVFLALTGHTAEDQPSEDEPEGSRR
jgi:oleandomycin transport system ATP-binding protein